MVKGEYNDYVRKGQIGLLFVEPAQPPDQQPLIDMHTRKMAAALRQATHPPWGYRGWHNCSCGANSDNQDHIIGNLVTNSLAVHYLAFHRSEIPANELQKVGQLSFGEADPTDKELADPQKLVAERKARLKKVAKNPPSSGLDACFSDLLRGR